MNSWCPGLRARRAKPPRLHKAGWRVLGYHAPMAGTGKKQKSPPRRQPVLDHIEKALWPLVEPIGSITPDPANVRQHSDRNLEVIKGSLSAFRQQKPIVVDGDGICRAGNGTLEAARALGWTHIAVARTKLTGAEAVAYAIADNRSGDPEIGSSWDAEGLSKQLAEIDLTEFDLGFDGDEIERITGRFDVDPVGPPTLPDGDRDHFQQMTFTLHDDQVEQVKAAVQAAKEAGPFVGENENSNGNALARIVEHYLGSR